MPVLRDPDTRPLRPVLTGNDTLSPGSLYRRPQGIEHHLLLLTLGGRTDFGLAGGAMFPQCAGDLLLIEPHHAVDQDVSPDTSWPRLWVIFDPRPQWREWLNWPELAPGYRQIHLPTLGKRSEVRRHLEQMHAHAIGTHRRSKELSMNSLEAAILHCDEHNPSSQQGKLDPRLARATEYITRHLHERLTLEEIAESADLSVPHLTRLFRRQMSMSPMQFLESQRMQRACAMLQMTSQTITSIAEQLGFDDPFYFSTRFKRHTRMSPRVYRAHGQQS